MCLLYSSPPPRSDVNPRHRTLDSCKLSVARSRRESLHPGTFLSALAALVTVATISAFAATGLSPSSAQPSAASLPSAQGFGPPMQFEKNAGQNDRQVEFLAPWPGHTVFFTP